MRCALVDDGLVVNVILWDGITIYDPPHVLVELDDLSPVGPGWRRDGDQWVAPVQPDPLPGEL